MVRMLDVYLHRHLVGQLIQDDQGDMVFDYAQSWIEKPDAFALSHSLPLQKGRFSRKLCRGFFAGILPEAGQRKIIAKNLGISDKNDFALLEKIGGECAGAVTLLPTGQSLSEIQHRYRKLSDKELGDILKSLPRKPLMAGEEDVRLSLAGAQDKIAVHVKENNISIPLGGAPSTHILKPAIELYDGLVYNEALCLSLANAIGLPTAHATTQQVEGIDYLLVERYDRSIDSKGNILRLHQEDFCQALGVVPELKYQNEGGPSMQHCFTLLREISSAPVIDLQHLLDTVIFNSLIGNHDAHAKNFSLLYNIDGSIRLAPLYDLLCSAYYPELSQKMAMKIGREYKSDRIFPRHFETLADETDLAKPMVKRRVPELAKTVAIALEKIRIIHPIAGEIAALIQKRCQCIHARWKLT